MKNNLYKVLFAILFVFAGLSNGAIVQTSPWMHSNAEVSGSYAFTPGSSPVAYGNSGVGSFYREREKYGYNPKYKPNIVAFSHNNRPFILVGLDPNQTISGSYNLVEDPAANTMTLPSSAWFEHGYIQTIDETGNWVVIDLEEVYRSMYGYGDYYSDFQPYLGIFDTSDRVAFDSDGSMYFKAYARGYTGSGYTNLMHKLFYSPDGNMSDWRSLGLPADRFLEIADSYNLDKRPALLDMGGNKIGVTPTSKILSNYLMIGDRAQISDPCMHAEFAPMHTGVVNPSATIGYITHVVYLDSGTPVNGNETGQYYNWYDSWTGEVGTPILLGSTIGGATVPDGHNGPAIVADSQKNLHVVLGAHGHPLKYTHSEDGGQTWSTAAEFGADTGTYVSLVATPDDALHLVCRQTVSSTDEWKLWYFRKPAGGAWQNMGVLVEPIHQGYAIYYHRLTVDRLGRLFLYYSYYVGEMTSTEKTEYTTKWPDNPDPDTVIFSHDPVILTSSNGGTSWHLASTADFIDGITDLEAYYAFDNNSIADTSGKDRNMTGSVSGYEAGVKGKAAQFNGSTNISATFNQSAIFSKGAFSISCWAKPASTSNAAFIGGYLSNAGFNMMVESSTYRLHLYATTGDTTVNSSVSAVAGRWTHIGASFSPASGPDGSGNYTGTAKIYIGGALKETLTNVKFKPAGAGSLALAAKADGSSKFTGSIDEAAIYSYVLDANKFSKLAGLKCSPKAVYSEGLAKGDINEDSVVNFNDFEYIVDNWLITE